MWFYIVVVLIIILLYYLKRKEPDPIEKYSKIVGYEKGSNAKTILETALKRNKKKLGKNQAANSFIIADMTMFNTDIPDREQHATDYYNQALNRIIDNADIAQNADIPADFIIDRIVALDLPLRTEPARNAVRASRRFNVKLDKPRHQLKTQIVSDPQNVHDSAINDGIKKVYSKIQSSNQNFDQDFTLTDIETAIDKHKFSDDKKINAKRILGEFGRGNIYTPLNDTEDKILINIWKRAHHPDNTNQTEELKTAVLDSLSDGVEINANGNKTNVCMTGRCARVISSLTLLDADSNIAEPIKTVGLLRSEAFDKTRKILDQELNKMPKDFIDKYNSEDNNETETFQTNVKVQVEKELRNDYSKIDPRVVDTIVKDALAGI